MSNWKNTTLGKFIAVKRGHDLTANERYPGNVPVYGAAGQNGFHNTAIAKAPGVVIGRSGGSFGKVNFVDKDYWPHNTALYVTDYYGNDPYFVYYFLKNLDFSAFNSGSAQPSLNRNFIYPIKIKIPNKETQNKIGNLLRNLDLKIELNNRINAELEAMAKTLYDYWFVQFDFPDAKGKPYKASGGKMVYSPELRREIPEGWKVKDIGSVCDVIDCLHSKKPDYYALGKKFLLQLENIIDDGTIDISKKYFVSDEDYDTWTSRIEVKEGDIVITNAGRVGAFAQIPKGLVTGIGRNITAIRPKNIKPTYLFYYFGSIDIKRQILQNTDVGAFFKSLNVRGIKVLKVISPPDDIIKSFEQKAKPIRTLIENNIKANQQLTELRNWLLPMLMNGQVTIGEAEERVTMAAEPESAYGRQGEFGF